MTDYKARLIKKAEEEKKRKAAEALDAKLKDEQAIKANEVLGE